MKFILTALLCLLAFDALAVERSIKCSDDSWVVNPTDGDPDCPTNLTSTMVGDGLGHDTTDSESLASQTGGNAYAVICPAAVGAPSAQQIIDGNCDDDSTATDASDKTVGSTTLVFDGADNHNNLVPETPYVLAHVVERNGKRSKVRYWAFSTLNNPGGGGPDFTGAGLFLALADGGNTDETPTGTAGTATSGCTTMAAACSEFSHLSGGVGVNVYLAEGGVWLDRKWNITSGGTSSDLQQIDCFYDEGDDDGNPVQCATFE